MPSPGSGIGSSFGTKVETTYGTFAAPSARWTPVESCEIKRRPVYVKGNGLRGSDVRSKSERALTNQDAGGTIKSEVYYNAMGQLFGSLMGDLAATPTVVGTTGQQYTLAWSSTVFGQSFSIQQGIPDTAQTVHNWQTMGCKVTDAQFECSPGSALMSTWTVDAQDHFESATSIATPTEPSDPYYSWANMVVKIGAFGSETKVDGVSKWTGTFKRALDDKRFNAGNLTTNPNVSYAIKDEQLTNGFSDIGGTLDTEYLNDALFENYFQTETPFSLIVAFTSTIDAGTATPYSISFNFPCCYFIGDDPTIAGPQIVKPSMPFEVWNDGTHAPATITIVGTDTTL